MQFTFDQIIPFVISFLGGGALSLIAFNVYKIIILKLDPIQYVTMLYGFADEILLNLDDNIIDKIPMKNIKDDIQERIDKVLEQRETQLKLIRNKLRD